MRTIFPKEIGDTVPEARETQKESGQLPGKTEKDVKFPERLRSKKGGKVWAIIYRLPKQAQPFRLYWRARVDGVARSRMKDFTNYSQAKAAGNKLVGDLEKGSQAAVLSPGQASAAIVAVQRLQKFYEDTGKRVSLPEAVSQFCEAATKAGDRTLGEIVDAFLRNLAVVQRVDLAKAVEEYLLGKETQTKAKDGARAELSGKYFYNLAIHLRRFAAAFPNTAICDLGKQHVDKFMSSLESVPTKSRNHRAVTSPKSRNHHRAAIRQFLLWAVKKDYLSATHRLNEAEGLTPQNGNTAEIDFYTPAELQALLEASEGPLRAMVAIGGLAGLRTQEMLRLTWEDVRRVENHIEVSSKKSKTRQRRLVEVVPALAQWLAPFTEFTGKIWTLHEVTFQQHLCDLCARAHVEVKGTHTPVPRKQNGLRHSFCTYHYALHGNENLTAQQAGHSPSMLHRDYKGLATKRESERWFGVSPEQPANAVKFGTDAQP
jgi:integrase